MRTFRYINARQWKLQNDREFRRVDFRSRQRVLIALAVTEFVAFVLFGHCLFLLIAVLAIQTGSVEALRFRKTGCYLQTKRAIWRGATPHDIRARKLLRPDELKYCRPLIDSSPAATENARA